MIVRARTVVPMTGEPMEDGAVVVSGREIIDAGRFDEMRQRHTAEVLDLGEQVLMPGLINAHCHLDYTVLRGRIGRKGSFADWIRGINEEKAKLTEQDYVDSINAGFAEARRFGTTTIVNLTAFPKLIAAVLEPIKTWWFGELIDVRNPQDAERIANEAAATLRAAPRWGLAPHAPYTASRRLYGRCGEIARDENVLLTTHLAESQAEMEMFRDASGPVYRFLHDLGRPMDDCGRETPLSFFLRTRTPGERWIIAHLNELGSGDFELLAGAPKFHIAHCPRSHTFFDHAPFEPGRLRDLGFNICLGTDSLASNSSLSLFAEMREVLRKQPGLAPRKAVEMATVNGAAAVDQENRLGCIRPGAAADLIALPIRTGSAVFEEIVAFDGVLSWTMVDGKIGLAPPQTTA